MAFTTLHNLPCPPAKYLSIALPAILTPLANILSLSQYSCLENPMDRGVWWAAVHGVAKSQIQLSDFIFTHWRRNGNPLQYSCLENPVDRGAWQATVHKIANSQT